METDDQAIPAQLSASQAGDQFTVYIRKQTDRNMSAMVNACQLWFQTYQKAEDQKQERRVAGNKFRFYVYQNVEGQKLRG